MRRDDVDQGEPEHRQSAPGRVRRSGRRPPRAPSWAPRIPLDHPPGAPGCPPARDRAPQGSERRQPPWSEGRHVRFNDAAGRIVFPRRSRAPTSRFHTWSDAVAPTARLPSHQGCRPHVRPAAAKGRRWSRAPRCATVRAVVLLTAATLLLAGCGGSLADVDRPGRPLPRPAPTDSAPPSWPAPPRPDRWLRWWHVATPRRASKLGEAAETARRASRDALATAPEEVRTERRARGWPWGPPARRPGVHRRRRRRARTVTRRSDAARHAGSTRWPRSGCGTTSTTHCGIDLRRLDG